MVKSEIIKIPKNFYWSGSKDSTVRLKDGSSRVKTTFTFKPAMGGLKGLIKKSKKKEVIAPKGFTFGRMQGDTPKKGQIKITYIK